MGVINIEGKSITLDDRIIDAGMEAIKAALSVDFPDVENADITIERPAHVGAPRVASVTKRGTGLGNIPAKAFAEIIEHFERAPEYVNPALALAEEIRLAEAQGNLDVTRKAAASGALARAIDAGEREGAAVQRALAIVGKIPPSPLNEVPEGF